MNWLFERAGIDLKLQAPLTGERYRNIAKTLRRQRQGGCSRLAIQPFILLDAMQMKRWEQFSVEDLRAHIENVKNLLGDVGVQ